MRAQPGTLRGCEAAAPTWCARVRSETRAASACVVTDSIWRTSSRTWRKPMAVTISV